MRYTGGEDPGDAAEVRHVGGDGLHQPRLAGGGARRQRPPQRGAATSKGSRRRRRRCGEEGMARATVLV